MALNRAPTSSLHRGPTIFNVDCRPSAAAGFPIWDLIPKALNESRKLEAASPSDSAHQMLLKAEAYNSNLL